MASPTLLPSLIALPELVAVLIALFAVYLVGKYDIRAQNVAKRERLAACILLVLAVVPMIFGKYGVGFDAGEFIYSRF